MAASVPKSPPSDTAFQIASSKDSRSAEGCQPMMRSVVCRARRMTWQGSRIISRTNVLNPIATYFFRSAL